MALVRQTYKANSSLTIPAGVFVVRVFGLAAPSVPQVGQSSVAYIGNDGSCYAFGNNAFGDLGIGTVTPASAPFAVLNSLSLNFQQLISTWPQTPSPYFGITAAGDAYGWGFNAQGQLGIGNVTPQSSPIAVLGSLKWSTISSGAGTNIAAVAGLTPQGVAYMWGTNASGQLGTGNVTTVSSPTAVLGGLTFKQVLTLNSGSTTLGLTTAGAAYGWGFNSSGGVGNGNVTPQSSPIAVLGGLTFASIYADSGGQTCYGLTAVGALYGWGVNANGQLGVGDVVPRSSPVAVLGGLTFAQVSIQTGSVVAITPAGVAYAWGSNTNGQLGTGDTIPRSSPVAVLGGLTFASVFTFGEPGIVGQNISGGLTAAGALYMWGFNANGQLGNGNVTSQSSPIAVLGGLSFVGATGYYTNMAAWSTSGQVYTWGINTNGQLGLGNVTPQSSPVAVIGARFPNLAQTQYVKEIAVTPGTAYAITVQNPVASFGTNQIGPMVTQMVVEYEQ